MNRIVLLPEHLKHMIAAGEVIEAPFSVVKELVENSIDAGATEIDVQVADAGLKRIYVRDNGFGIFRDDAPLSIREHATSKISDISALQSITTFGFRGEALSSISSISDFVLLSKREDEETGSRLESRNGTVTLSDYAGSRGTTVIVDNLFFNMPARKKFLKAKSTELRNIRETLLKMSLAVPAVSFSFEVDGKRNITLPAAQDLHERIKQVYGPAVYDRLYFEQLADIKVRLYGFLSKPDYIRHNKSMQQLFVNRRPVEHKYLSYHLSRAYDAVIPRGKFPAALLFMEIDPELIDVNIHPAKREVKLFDQKYIDSLIYSLASKALDRGHSVPDKLFSAAVSGMENDETGNMLNRAADIPIADQQQFRNFRMPLHLSGEVKRGPEEPFTNSREGLSVEESLFKTDDIINSGVSLTVSEDMGKGPHKILGTIFGTYIIVEEGDKVHFIDFHAAHERMLYDRLKSGFELETQELLFPVQIELPAADFSLVMDNINSFSSCGFEIEEFSDDSIVVRAVPAVSGNYKIDELVKNMIDNIREEKDSNELNEKIVSSLACHGAKRSGDILSAADMVALTSEVFGGELELRCPHGRPFLFTINKNDIERMFKRL